MRLLAAQALHQGGIGLAIHKHDIAAFPLGQLRHGHGLYRSQVGEGGGIDLLGRVYPRRFKGAEVLGRGRRLGHPLPGGGGRLGVGRAGPGQVVEGVDGRGQVADEVLEAWLVPHNQLDLLAPPRGLLRVNVLAGQAAGAVPEGLGLGKDILDGGHDAADDLAQTGLVEGGVDEQLGRGLLAGVGPLEAPADEAVLLDAQLSVEGLDLGIRIDALDGVLDKVGRLLCVVVEPAQPALDAESPAGEGHDGFHGGSRRPGWSRQGITVLGWAWHQKRAGASGDLDGSCELRAATPVRAADGPPFLLGAEDEVSTHDSGRDGGGGCAGRGTIAPWRNCHPVAGTGWRRLRNAPRGAAQPIDDGCLARNRLIGLRCRRFCVCRPRDAARSSGERGARRSCDGLGWVLFQTDES